MPTGAEPDYEFCNLRVESGSHVSVVSKSKLGGSRKVLAAGCDGDPLTDDQTEFVGIMRDKGVDTVS